MLQIGISLDETTTIDDIDDLLHIFGSKTKTEDVKF